MVQMGMDADAVEAAGRQLRQYAAQLGDVTGRINVMVGSLASAWHGSDAETFANQWWPQHRAQLQSAGASVDGLGQSAIKNAEDQREVSSSGRAASSGGGSSAGVSLGWLSPAIAAVVDGDGMESALNTVGWLKDFKGAAALGEVFTVVGAIGSAATVVQDLHDHDVLLAAVDTGTGMIGTGLGVATAVAAAVGAGTVAAGLGVVGLGVGVGAQLVDWAIPSGAAPGGDLYDWEAKQMFGSGVDPNSLTADQKQLLHDHYSGVWGEANVISDNMSKTADETTTPLLNAAFGFGKDAVTNVGNWMRTL